jgi:microcystin-dependent protein
VGQVNAGDLSFTCDPTVGNPANWPTGANGPFTVGLDQGLPTFEKILCSAFNPGTLQFTVAQYGSWNGRGYDGPGAQSHVPMSNVPQVILTWSSAEADETNQNVHYVMGGAAGAPDGLTLMTQGGVPTWQVPGGGQTQGLFPLGGIMPWAALTSAPFPVNFFECNGQLLSQTTYASLYNLLGNTYGGTAGTNFGLPDLRDCYITGMGGALASTMGQKGGGRTIGVAQLPAHSHTDTGHGHLAYIAEVGTSDVGVFTTPTAQANAIPATANAGATGYLNVSYSASNHWQTGNAQLSTVGSGANYDPPFIGLKWLMRCL